MEPQGLGKVFLGSDPSIHRKLYPSSLYYLSLHLAKIVGIASFLVVAEVDKRPHIFGKAPATPKF
jgi:hypothetical protein